MAILKGKARSELSKAIWRRRKREGGKATCYFCHSPIFAGGVADPKTGRKFHKGCFEALKAGLKPEHIGRNPRRIMRREPRDAYRFYGARALNPKGRIVSKGDYGTFRIGDRVVLDDKWTGTVVRASPYTRNVYVLLDGQPYEITVHISRLEKIRVNPGTNWHVDRAKELRELSRIAKTREIRSYLGQRAMENELAADESRRLGMNPRAVKYGHIDSITRPEVSRRTWVARRRAGGYGT